jgi:peptidase M28-like protein
MAFRRMTVIALLWLAAAASGPAVVRLPDAAARAVDAMSADDLHTYVETLASDAFAGRGVGDAGNRAAEEFICATLVKNGVTPAGQDGSCYQAVDVYRPTLGSRAHLTVSKADGTPLADFAAGADFYPLPETGDAAVSAPLVFADHGVSAPDLKHDDYANVDAQGAIVLVIEGQPDRLVGGEAKGLSERASLGSLSRKMADAASHGARAVLLVSGYLPDYHSVWPDHPSVRASDYRLVSALKGTPAVATLSERAAAPLRRALGNRERLSATITPDLVVSPVTMHNVLGIVEGRDPTHRAEMIVVGAHLDHDGTDDEGRIYNGADDNASGTAAVLAAAAAFARAAASGERPLRPVLFALWNGEEKGSLGAEAFVAAPQPNRRIVANLNLDMVGRHEEVLDPNDWRFHGFPKVSAAASANTLHVLGYSYSRDLTAELRSANEAVGLTLLEDYDQTPQHLLERSDNWPFLEHGIPALFLTTGLHPDYHTPEDDTARIDFRKLTRVARLAARMAWIVADSPEPRLKRPEH